MTGMTDISRHGGDKSNRDELDIRVRDDALVDPELLAATSAEMSHIDDPDDRQLVDDSDDDDDYGFDDAGPGFATKIVQATFSVLFFPVILLCKAVKAGPSSLKHIGPFLKSLFSPSGRLGKILITLGTITGMIWLSRKIGGFVASISAKRKAKQLARQQADDDAALEREILAEEAAKNQNAASDRRQTESQHADAQTGNGRRKARAVVQFGASDDQTTNDADAEHNAESDTENDAAGSRKKFGFGQLSRLADAFKRSRKRRSDDDAAHDDASGDIVTLSSARNDALVDDDGESGGRWSRKKTSMFAAACILLLLVGGSFARNVLQTDTDTALNDNAEKQAEGVSFDSDPPLNPPVIPETPQFNNYPGYQSSPNAARYTGFGHAQPPAAPDANDSVLPAAPTSIPPSPSASPLAGSDATGWDIPPAPYSETQPDVQPGMQTDNLFARDVPPVPNQGDMSTPPTYGMPGGAASTVAFTEPGMYSPGAGFPVEVHDPPDTGSGIDDAPLVADNGIGFPGTPPNYDVNNWQPQEHAATDTITNNTAMTDFGNPTIDNTGAGYADTGYAGMFDRNATDGGFGLATTAGHVPENPPAFSLQPTTGFALQESSQPIHTSTTGGEAAPPLADIFRPSQPLDTDSDSAWAAAPTQPDALPNVLPGDSLTASTGFPLRNETPVYDERITTPAQANGGFSLADTASQSQPSQPLWEQPETTASTAAPMATSFAPGLSDMTQGLTGVSMPAASNGELAFSPMTEQLSPRSVEPMQMQLQPVSTTPVAAADNFVMGQSPGVVQPLIVDELHPTVGSGVVSPSRHTAAVPMMAPSVRNDANYTAPVLAQTDAGATSYSAQPHTTFGTASAATPGATLVGMTAIDTQASGGNFVYVVQPGDSIYKIAKQELGSVRRYREIYDLNRDRLPIGQDTLTAGTELLLPGR